MMFIYKHTVQIFQAAGHETHWIISLTLCFIKSFTKIKQIYYFKINPGSVTNFSIDQFFIALLGYSLAHFRVRNCFIKNTGFQSNPISLRPRGQSPACTGSHRPSLNKKPGPQSKGHVGRKSVLLIFRPQFSFTMESPPSYNNVVKNCFYLMIIIRITIA